MHIIPTCMCSICTHGHDGCWSIDAKHTFSLVILQIICKKTYDLHENQNSYVLYEFCVYHYYPLAAASRFRLLETEPKLFVFETSYHAFCGRYCFQFQCLYSRILHPYKVVIHDRLKNSIQYIHPVIAHFPK